MQFCLLVALFLAVASNSFALNCPSSAHEIFGLTENFKYAEVGEPDRNPDFTGKTKVGTAQYQGLNIYKVEYKLYNGRYRVFELYFESSRDDEELFYKVRREWPKGSCNDEECLFIHQDSGAKGSLISEHFQVTVDKRHPNGVPNLSCQYLLERLF